MFRAALPRTTKHLLLLGFWLVVFAAPFIPAFAQETVATYAPGGIGGVIYFIFTTIGGIFTFIGGNLLDFAIATLVLGMGDLLRGNIGVAVDTLWVIIRDLFNILFIFGLIWIGLQTILGIGNTNLQRTLGGIIVAALLINFSLFITKAVIDFANIAAVQIYNTGFGQMTGEDGVLRASISETFMQNMQLNSYAADFIEAPDEESTVLGAISDFVLNPRAIGFGFLIMILQIIAGFVFLSGAILLIYRFIALIAYMIFSPAMFVGLIFDKFMQYQKQWWKGFLSNAFVAPAYMFMIYLSAVIFVGINGTFPIEATTFNDVYQAESGQTGAFGLVLFFSVMAGFLIASTMVAKQMGAAGASTVMKVGMTGANTLRGWSAGYSKRAGQNIGSAAFNKFAYGFRGKDYEKAEEKLKERRLRYADGTAGWRDKAALSAAAIAGAGSIDDRQAALKKGQEYKPFGGKSYKDRKDADKALTNQNAQGRERTELLASIDDGFSETQGDKFITMVDKITSSSPDEISKILGKYEKSGETAKYQAVVNNLTPNQFKKVLDLKEENFSEDSKNKLRGGRAVSTKAKLQKDKTGAAQSLATGLKQASVGDLATLDFNDDLLNNAAYLQGTQLDDMKKDDFFGGPRFEAIKKKHESDLNEMVMNGKAKEIITSRKGSTNIAKLPADILKKEEFMNALADAKELNIGLLSQIASSKDINDKDKPAIGDAARRALTRTSSDLDDNYKRFFERGVGQNLT